MTLPSLHRRRWLQRTSAAALLSSAFLPHVSRARELDPSQPIVVGQIADMSPNQQDVSRDFLIGSRTAWQVFNAQGGLRGQPVQHLVIEVNAPTTSTTSTTTAATATSAAARGGASSGAPVAVSATTTVQAAWRQLRESPQCVVLSGCVGDNAAQALVALQSTPVDTPPIALVAPWLHSPPMNSETVFDIFPGYQEQIAHALKNLSLMGVKELGVVYASVSMRLRAQEDIAVAARALGLRLHHLPLPGSTGAAAEQLTSPAQAIILFVGGTPELHSFMRNLQLQPGRQCYIVALSDVNLQVLSQLGTTARNASVIATQAVPLVSSTLPIVRAYREALARLYDEAPTPQGLAGFVAARYTMQVLQNMTGPLHRATVLAAFDRRQAMNLGGFALAFQNRRRSHAFITQSMLTNDGRIVG